MVALALDRSDCDEGALTAAYNLNLYMLLIYLVLGFIIFWWCVCIESDRNHDMYYEKKYNRNDL